MYDQLSAARRVLWLGAHKTGTTFLQGILDASADALAQAGVAYMNLDTFRDKYTRPLLFDNFEEAPAPASEFPIGSSKTILFDENIPGLVQNAVSADVGLYPQLEERVGAVVDHLDYTPDLILFGIRRLDGYLPSLYCETLKSTPFRPFLEFMEHVPKGLLWHPMLVRLARMYPGVPLVVYLAEELRGHERAFLSALTGVPVPALHIDNSRERPGFSQKAINRLKALSQTRPVVRQDVGQMIREFPKSADNPGFAPFGAQRQERFKTLYAQDRSLIQKDAQMDLLDLGIFDS
ncbi:hypothetical protein [uncultured Tateyamaria sp.]|uniref:hypothetical protein n=1 Tax=uncultured Tateyamaria sp. TaxID=455651 RepID=UPI002638F126|nr:hypothetical protein [uncultured Tateyamaria sp.]